MRACPKPPMVKLSKKDNSELKSHTKTYLQVKKTKVQAILQVFLTCLFLFCNVHAFAEK